MEGEFIQNNALKNIFFLMSLKQNRKLIGRKLEFKSYIEKNEAFFKFKLNRIYNLQDQSLYKMMTVKSYLENNIKQFSIFLFKIKLALISNDQNCKDGE